MLNHEQNYNMTEYKHGGRRASSSRKKSVSKTNSSGSRLWRRIAVGVIAAVVAAGAVAVWVMSMGHEGDATWVYVPRDASLAQVRDSLQSSLGERDGERVYELWRLFDGSPSRAHGAYRIEPGQRHVVTARRMKRGAETPVKVQWQNIRTLDSLAQRISTLVDISPEQFKTACSSVLIPKGYSMEEFPAAFLPDSYELYWSSSPEKVVERLTEYRDRFWNDERRAKARKLGLKPTQGATVASIVEEESLKSDERPVIARLYLNRLKRDMPLQADPTVKFATGNFALRRITGAHLATESPYNTYKHRGLPPGPIRIASRQGIDAVLNAPDNGYLYMCAKEDFSGYHNFASDYATHQANAARYRAELNRRNIH